MLRVLFYALEWEPGPQPPSFRPTGPVEGKGSDARAGALSSTGTRILFAAWNRAWHIVRTLSDRFTSRIPCMNKPELKEIGKPPGTQGWEDVGAGLGGPAAQPQPQPQGEHGGSPFSFKRKLWQTALQSRGGPSSRRVWRRAARGPRWDPTSPAVLVTVPVAVPLGAAARAGTSGGLADRRLCGLPVRSALPPAGTRRPLQTAQGVWGARPFSVWTFPVERRHASLSGSRRPRQL